MWSSFSEAFGAAFVALFVIVEPFGVVPYFGAMTLGRPAREVERIARRAALAGGGVLLFFLACGGALFAALGIDVEALRAGGGLLLLLTALEMMRGKVSTCRCGPDEVDAAARSPDIAIVPIAIPFLSGPGAVATVTMMAEERSSSLAIAGVGAAVVAVFGVSYVVLRSAVLVQRVLGTTGLTLVQRVLGFVLAALSSQMLVQGVHALWRG